MHQLDSTRSFVACDHPEHPHARQFLICRKCGAVVEAKDKRIDRAVEELGERYGFPLERHSVELTGACAACAGGVTRSERKQHPGADRAA